MSSERTARFSERAYGRFIGLGWFIMGIVINHIRQEFSSLDTELLSELKD